MDKFFSGISRVLHGGMGSMMDDMMSGGSNMNSTMSMDDVYESAMVFTSWNTYKLQLLFMTWNITSPLQYTLSWFAVAFAAVFFHLLGCCIHCVDKEMARFLWKESKGDNSSIGTGFEQDKDEIIYIHPRPVRPRGWIVIKMLHGFLTASKYALSLFLMLVAMTFNPGLFLALFVGYWFGDIVFCDMELDLSMNTYQPLFHNGKGDGITGTIFRLVLCLPSSRFHETESLLAYPIFSIHQMDVKVMMNSMTKFCLWWSPRFISLIFLIILLVWIVQVEGGFGYDEATIFGWHALFMSFFIVMFTNEALLTYKAPLLIQFNNNRVILKLYHSMNHIFSIVAIILGLIAIKDYKNLSPSPIMFPFFTAFSPHSWMGFVTIALFTIQFFYALWLYVIAKWSVGTEEIKEKYVQIHHFIGYCMFVTGLATCATGFQDMQSSDLSAFGYEPFSTYAQLACAGSILLVILGISTFAALKFLPRVISSDLKLKNETIVHETEKVPLPL